MTSDDARIAEIRERHAPFDFGMHHPVSGKWISRISCTGCHRPWPCEQSVLGERLDALAAERDYAREMCDAGRDERDALAARLAAAEAALEALRESSFWYAHNGGDVLRLELLSKCEEALAALAGSREQAAGEGE